MSYFPQLTNGILTQLPFSAGKRFDTYVADMPTGRRWAYANFATPLGVWALNFTSITDSEVTTAEAFFDSMAGMLGRFTLLDPGGNLVQFSEDYTDSSWTKTLVSLSAIGSDPDPFGGTAATTVTATAANPVLSTVILPDGNAAGFVVCASAYVYGLAGFDMRIGFSDSGAGDQGSKVYSVDGNWRRLQFQLHITTNGAISLYFAGWPSGASFRLFGVQVAPLPGAGAYNKTPGNYGLHSKCYFATDQFKVKVNGFNDNALVLPIEETF